LAGAEATGFEQASSRTIRNFEGRQAGADISRRLPTAHEIGYSPSFGSTVAAALNSSDAAVYSGNSDAEAGMYCSSRSRVL